MTQHMQKMAFQGQRRFITMTKSLAGGQAFHRPSHEALLNESITVLFDPEAQIAG